MRFPSYLQSLFILIGLFSAGVYADDSLEKDDSEAILPSWYLEYTQSNGEVKHALVALGLEQDTKKNSFGGVYFNYEMLSGKGDIKGLGVLAFNLEKNRYIDGAKAYFGISETVLPNYERTGLDFGLGIYFHIWRDFSWYVDSGYRLTWLSLNFNNNELMEVNTLVGINYRPSSTFNVFVHYRYDGFVSQKLKLDTLQEDVQFGLSWFY